MIYNANSEEERLKAIESIEQQRDTLIEVRTYATSTDKDIYGYVWYLMQLVGGKYSYTPTDFHMIATQKMTDFAKHFEAVVEKSDGTKVTVYKNIWNLKPNEILDFCEDLVIFASTKCGGLVLPTFDAYKEKRIEKVNSSELIDFMISKFH